VSGDEACLVACVGRERGRLSTIGGASELGEVGERGAGLKRGEGMRGWSENARTWASPRRGRGREVRDRLMGGVRGTERERERESERVRKSNNADRSAPQSSERERGREEVRGWRRQARPACQGPGARRRRARGWAWWADWAELAFLFF
jgi:hypothetical protein